MIITTTKILHSAILKVIFILFLLLFSLMLVLAHGIHLSNIDLPGLKVKEFYIKLDKKLILEVGRLTIGGKKREASNAVEQIDRIGAALRYLPNLFERIRIDEIVAGDEKMYLLFHDDIFHIETDRLHLVTRVYWDEENRVLFAKIDTLHILGPGVTVRGRFVYDPAHGVWRGDGSYRGLNLEGDFTVWQKDSTIGFRIDSLPTDSIKPLVDYLAPPEPVKVWIYPKIPAKRYILHYLEGEVALDRHGRILFDPDKIEGYATAFDGKIHFHPDVPPVHVERIDITYRHNTLGFKLKDPVYEKKRLDGSFVRIRNLLGKGAKTELDAHIVVDDRFDESIRRVLSAYDIPVPFVQTEGRMKGVTDLTVALKTGKITAYKGDYRSDHAVLLFDGILPVPVDGLHVKANRLRFDIAPCTVRLEPYLTTRLKGMLDLEKKRGRFETELRKLDLAAGGIPLLHAADDTLFIDMDFSKAILFTLPALDAKVHYMPGGGMELFLHDLSKLAPFFEGPLTPVKGGTLHAIYKKERSDVDARLVYRNDILTRKGRPYESFRLKALLLPDKLEATLDDLATLTVLKNQATLRYRDVDINIIKLRNLFKAYEKRKGRSEKGDGIKIIHVHGKNSVLRGNYAYLPCESYEMKVTLHPYSTLFESKNGSGTIHGLFYDDNIKIVGRHLPDRVIHGIPALDDLYGGYFNFDAVGRFDDFNGTVTFQDTLWTNSAVYNNILATLNTVPAILTLKNPGFNKKGFKIKRGAIRYHYRSPVFHFDSIAIHGESANIFGKGAIDFEKESIDVKMRIQFLESVSATMHKIPIAGYILLGDDGTISLGLSVTGPLKDPKVKTSAAKDIVTAPLNIIKRTITFPFHLFE